MNKMTHALIIISKNQNAPDTETIHSNLMFTDKEQVEGTIMKSINLSSETLEDNQKTQLIYHLMLNNLAKKEV